MTVDYETDYHGYGIINIENDRCRMMIDFDDARILVDRLKQILREHPEE